MTSLCCLVPETQRGPRPHHPWPSETLSGNVTQDPCLSVQGQEAQAQRLQNPQAVLLKQTHQQAVTSDCAACGLRGRAGKKSSRQEPPSLSHLDLSGTSMSLLLQV